MSMHSSGKLVIFGIVAIAIASAAVSWWFRYSTTHRAAEFWGPQTARLIRDAPIVKLYQMNPPTQSRQSSRDAVDFLNSTSGRDVSKTPGLTHLRKALLEDRSYRWPAQPIRPGDRRQWALRFAESPSGEGLILWFSPDWQYVRSAEREKIVSCEPIADGLAEMLGELAPAAENPR